MENILNLALKKEVFEGLQNGTTNEIIIDGSRWWKKRLMDLDTGKFKDFSIACVSSGSSDKIEYEIENIEQRGRDFVVTVNVCHDEGEQSCTDNDDSDYDGSELEITYPEDVVPPVDNDQQLEPINVNPVTIETGEDGEVIVKQTYVKPMTSVTQKVLLKNDDSVETLPDQPEDNSSDNIKSIKDTVRNLIDKFCELKDVYVVNMDSVTIRNNGQVFGCKKRLIADRDSDVKFNFVKKEFIKYPNTLNSAFTLQVLYYLNNMLKNNYVFINKNACKFREEDSGNIILTIVAVGKRKYFFAK